RFLVWDPSDEAIHGYVVERKLPGEKRFLPVAFLDKTAERFFDENLPQTVTHYRLRKWDGSGLGRPTPVVLVFDSGTETVSYDFRMLTDVNELRADGWTSAGLQSES